MKHTPSTLLATLALLALPLFTHAQPAWLNDGLVAYYPFDGNTNDESGSSAHLTGTDIGFAPDRFGKDLNAAGFNGASSRLDTTTQFEGGRFTFAVWVRVPLNNALIGQDIGWYTPWFAGNEDAGVGINPDKGWIRVVAGQGGSDVGMTMDDFDRWIHIVGTYASSQVSIYVNGATRAMVRSPWPVQHEPYVSTQYFGYVANPARNLMSGLMDDFRIYNRALSASEVAELYAYESQPPVQTPHKATAEAQVVNGFLVGPPSWILAMATRRHRRSW